MKTSLLLLCLTAFSALSQEHTREPGDWTTIPVLLTAAYPGEYGVEKMQQLLQAGHNPNTRAANGSTPLMIAANFGNADMVRLLLEAGADATATRHDGSNALHSLACAEVLHSPAQAEQKLTEIARMLIQAGANLNQHNNDRLSPLDVAACKVRMLVKPFLQAGAMLPNPEYKHFRDEIRYLINHGGLHLLLEHGLKPNLSIRNTQSLLQLAAEMRSRSAVHALIQAGADVNALQQGISPLWYTLKNKTDTTDSDRLSIARMLLEAGANPLLLKGQTDSKDTMLHSCAACSDTALLQLLLRGREEHINVRDTGNRTPLCVAARYGSAAMVQLLINSGADVNAVDTDPAASAYGGFSIAACAAGSPHQATEKLKLILEAGAVFDAEAQKNIMLRAAQNGNTATMRYLLSLGVSANLRTAYGIPLVQTAAKNPDAGVLEALLAAGADADAANEHGLTALHWAVQSALTDHSKRIILLLLDAGGDLNASDMYGRTPWDCAFPQIKEWLQTL